jgi:hypothetical protein
LFRWNILQLIGTLTTNRKLTSVLTNNISDFIGSIAFIHSAIYFIERIQRENWIELIFEYFIKWKCIPENSGTYHTDKLTFLSRFIERDVIFSVENQVIIRVNLHVMINLALDAIQETKVLDFRSNCEYYHACNYICLFYCGGDLRISLLDPSLSTINYIRTYIVIFNE